MIKYLELTAPERSEFRQAKILSIEVSEGDHVDVGDTLFKVKSGSSEIDLPSTMQGNIAEIIADAGENISMMTPLILLETEVEGSSASVPDEESKASGKSGSAKRTQKKQKKEKTKRAKKNQTKRRNKALKKAKDNKQASLDLGDGSSQTDVPDPEGEISDEHKDSKPQENSETSDQAADHSSEQTERDKIESTNPSSSSSMSGTEVTVPDIGTDSAKVIEILVNVGDQVAVEDPLLTLESDKASMDVPSPVAGVIKTIAVALDEDVSEGTVLFEIAPSAETAVEASAEQPVDQQTTPAAGSNDSADGLPDGLPDGSPSGSIAEVTIPDIGGDPARVIEILVAAGQQVALEDPLVTLESDKASMDVPSSAAGTIESIEVQVDQEVTEGVVIVKVMTDQAQAGAEAVKTVSEPTTAAPPTAAVQAAPMQAAPMQAAPASVPTADPGKSHASPSIRRFARELGVQLSQVAASGRKGRITKNDVKLFVKGVMTGGADRAASQAAAPTGSGIPLVPEVDFSKFGEVDIQPLNKIKRLTAKNLHRSWLNVPHVTHNDESDISDLESFRKQLNAENAGRENAVKLSPLAFIVKAVVRALQAYPQFNSSLDGSGENLVYKKYINIGIAVETPNGLVVPVIKDADKMSVSKLAETMGALAAKARDKKLSPADMSGACFTISSLGGIGGTSFSPIVNAPEVAILGVSRSKLQPIWDGEEFKPAMMLPLSLSYDHRVIDGAEAARFTRHIADVLEDVRRLTV